MNMPKDDDGYINLNGLIKELSISSIRIHTKLWELYLSEPKIGLNRTLDILKALIIGMNKAMPFKFSVDFGEGEIFLRADFRFRDRSILINLARGIYER